MSNMEKYRNAFIEGLGVDEEGVEKLVFGEIPEWDSVGHMTLVAALENAFDIMMETDDIIDFSSFDKGIELLKKYNVVIE